MNRPMHYKNGSMRRLRSMYSLVGNLANLPNDRLKTLLAAMHWIAELFACEREEICNQ